LLKNLTIALCQYNVIWNKPCANFAKLEELTAYTDCHILVLPEMFSTGFLLDPFFHPDLIGIQTRKWLSMASAKKTVLGSVALKENNSFYNRILVYENQKEICFYNKKHSFVGSESEKYTAGSELKHFYFDDWKISLNICYDLRFPVWCRAQDSHVMIFCANWPTSRANHWHSLLKARAIENQCYVIGVNRLGTDGNDWEYQGDSVVFDFSGKELLNLENQEICSAISLSKVELDTYRADFPFLKDKDSFDLNLLNSK
jgi:omega-amidase